MSDQNNGDMDETQTGMDIGNSTIFILNLLHFLLLNYIH